MFAGLAVGTAATVWADPPTMSGHYIRTETDPQSGRSIDEDWYATSCTGGCAQITTGSGTYQARLVNNQWTMDANGSTTCPDGSTVPNANTSHYIWDPNTLVGTGHVTEKIATCGATAPESWTITLTLRQAA
jgi:hypothetical protein